MTAPAVVRASGSRVAHGLAANWRQIALLAAVNAFVGGMVGMERSILPVLAECEFGIASKTAAVSFIVAFGVAKALTNLIAGRLSERLSRRRVLILGWLAGVPVPLVLIFAPSWEWVIGANALLGVNQGLCWSMTVNMKVDLAGAERRGAVLGLNEAAGYLSVAAASFLTGVIADAYGLRPEPFYLGIAFVALGLALSVLCVRDTSSHVAAESARHEPPAPPSLGRSFASTWRRPEMFGLSQAGLVSNLNDGLAWGIFPLFFISRGLDLDRAATLVAAYPLVWGSFQLATGWLGDLFGRRPVLVLGMVLQGLAICAVGLGDSFAAWLGAVSVLGVGTALAYPTLLAAVSDTAHPAERATAMGVYRFWRDTGIAIGALASGGLADALGFEPAIQVVAALTVASGILAALTLRGRPGPRHPVLEVTA